VARIEKSIEIRAPPEKVWEILAFDRFPEWMDMMKSVEYTSEVKNNCIFEITDSLENEKLTHRLWEKVPFGTLGGLVTYTLEPVGAGTRFTYEMEPYKIPWGILGKILTPLWMREGRKEYEKALENLKGILEK
jgi:uncharacterized membrane protein